MVAAILHVFELLSIAVHIITPLCDQKLIFLLLGGWGSLEEWERLH